MASAIKYCEEKFNVPVKIVCETKKVETSPRTGGTIKGYLGIEIWKTEKQILIVKDVFDFIEKFTPIKQSDNLINKIKKSYSENGSVTYNCGNGNQTFYFYEN
ncbi:hypothetical protein D3C85_1662910 [compost metagenome]